MKVLGRALEESNNDVGSAIKKLNEVCDGPVDVNSASVEESGVISDEGMLLYIVYNATWICSICFIDSSP